MNPSNASDSAVINHDQFFEEALPLHNNLNPIPERYRFLSGSALKVLACITMLIDHVGHHYFLRHDITLFIRDNNLPYTLYLLCRSIGRIAFPLFAFLLVEGFLHTRSRFKFGRNLLLFAFISEIPWNLVNCGEIIHPKSQNVFFTLFLGFLGMSAIHYLHDNLPRMGISLLVLMLISHLINCDYGLTGFGFLIMLYLLRNARLFQAVVGCSFLSSLWRSGIAFIPVLFYNDKRGFIKGRWKYAFYAFYPVHLFILFLIKYDFLSYVF